MINPTLTILLYFEISDKNFNRYLLPYLEKLNGKAKESTLAEAQKLVETTGTLLR